MMRKIEQPALLEVLDRILDKGIVVDAWIRFSLAGIDFLTVEARVVVASLETYLEYAGAIRNTHLQAAPPLNKPRLHKTNSRRNNRHPEPHAVSGEGPKFLDRSVISIDVPHSTLKAMRRASDL